MLKATRVAFVGLAACTLISTIVAFAGSAEARGRRRHPQRSHAAVAAPADDMPIPQSPPQAGAAGYFGPPPFYGYGYGYGPYWGAPRGDLGFALLGAMNGGGFSGFVECGNYYARSPGACGF